MSSGKRVAKRSLLGSRVMAIRRDKDGKFHPGVVQGQKGPDIFSAEKFTIRFDDGHIGTFQSKDIVGPGFMPVHAIRLLPGQTVYVTQNQREIQGTVIRHDFQNQDVIINVSEGEPLLKKIDDIRLIESRKSARLINSDTDFSKLADITIGNDKRKYRDYDVPRSEYVKIAGSRKRRTSDMVVDEEEVMTECTAAMVLMKLSCSPGSWNSLPHNNDCEYYSSSGASSYRSSTPSPPLSSSASTIDDGIVKDFPVVQSPSKVIYQCTYPGCKERRDSVNSIESHVRRLHLNRPDPHSSDVRDHEEEFYYTEFEEEDMGSPIKNGIFDYSFSGSASLVDHLDMARPAHEDPGTSRMMRVNNNLLPYSPQRPYLPQIAPRTRSMTMPMTITSSKVSPSKLILISPSERSQGPLKATPSPRRGGRDGKKCRKIYGLEQRELWCTQCKWKKACARFGANAVESANQSKNHTGILGQLQKKSPILLAASAPISSPNLLSRTVEIKTLNHL